MRLSDAEDFYRGSVVADWAKARDHDRKMAVETINRINDVVRAIGNLSETLAAINRAR